MTTVHYGSWRMRLDASGTSPLLRSCDFGGGKTKSSQDQASCSSYGPKRVLRND